MKNRSNILKANKLDNIEQQYQNFKDEVIFKYQLFSGLLLTLPFDNIDEAGAILPIFTKKCEEDLALGKTHIEIIESFWTEINLSPKRREQLLFTFLKFVERQIILFDAQINNSVGAIEHYIMSNTNSTSSIFEVYFLITLTNNYLHKTLHMAKDKLIKKSLAANINDSRNSV